MNRLPFGKELKTASDAQVEAANEREGVEGARRYQPTAEAIEQIRRGSRPSADRVRSWLHHPDQRVPSALMVRPKQLGTTTQKIWATQVIRARVIIDLEETGAPWSALADRMERAGVAGLREHAYSSEYDRMWPGEPKPPPLKRGHTPVDRLIHWIRAQTDTAGLIELVDWTQNASILKLVARHAGTVDEKLYDALLDHSTVFASDMAENPNLPASLAERMKAETIQSIVEEDGRFARVGRVIHGRHALQELSRRGALSFSEAERESLLGVVTTIPPQWEKNKRWAHSTEWGQAFGILTQVDRLPSVNWLRRLYERVKAHPRYTQLLAEHPRATTAFWREILDDASPASPFLLHYLAGQTRALRDPSVQGQLLASRNRRVMKRLLTQSRLLEVGQYRDLIRKFGRVKPESLLEHLQDEDARLDVLEPGDLGPLLSAKNGEVRVGAMTLLSQIGPKPQRHEPGPRDGPLAKQARGG